MQNFIKEAISSLNADNQNGALREIVDFSEEHLKRLTIYQEKETAIWNNLKKYNNDEKEH
jgi:hypothetical protein